MGWDLSFLAASTLKTSSPLVWQETLEAVAKTSVSFSLATKGILRERDSRFRIGNIHNSPFLAWEFKRKLTRSSLEKVRPKEPGLQRIQIWGRNEWGRGWRVERNGRAGSTNRRGLRMPWKSTVWSRVPIGGWGWRTCLSSVTCLTSEIEKLGDWSRRKSTGFGIS